MNTTTTTSNISQAEIDAAERIIDLNKNQVFWVIESRSHPEQHYKVFYNRLHGCIQCAPFDGEACPASVKGIPCRHKRIALAAEEEYRQLKAAERQAEQRAIEATAEYQREQLQQAMDAASRKLAQMEAEENGDQEAANREHTAVAIDGLQAYERKPFSILR